MVSNKELEAGLKAMAEDFHLPGGARKRLSRLVAGHLWWFDAAEQRGMSWRDMIRALAAAGVTGKGTKPVSVGTLSSTVWRARTKTAGEADGLCIEGRPGPKAIEPRGQPWRSPKRQPPVQTQQDRRRASPQNVDDARAGRPASKQPAGGDRPGRVNKDALAFMDRARAVRRRSEDD
jgi:hypothetical protein